MSGHDAFEEEMNHDVTRFLEAMRTELPRQLDPRLEADLIGRLAAEARAAHGAAAAAPTQALPRASRRKRFVLPARIALAAGLGMLAMAGLAVAGVNLPGAVDSAFEAAGVNLPNQDADEATSGEQTPTAVPAGPQQKGSANAQGKHGRSGSAPHGKAHAYAYGQQGGAPGNSENAPGQTKSAPVTKSHPAYPSKNARPLELRPKTLPTQANGRSG
jgi:hypothetical protein